LVSQTTKTNAKEKRSRRRKTEKDSLKYLTLEKEKDNDYHLSYCFFCLIVYNTNKKNRKKRRENMIHNTYDAITTSEKRNIKIDINHKKKFTGIEEEKKRYLFLSFRNYLRKVL